MSRCRGVHCRSHRLLVLEFSGKIRHHPRKGVSETLNAPKCRTLRSRGTIAAICTTTFRSQHRRTDRESTSKRNRFGKRIAVCSPRSRDGKRSARLRSMPALVTCLIFTAAFESGSACPVRMLVKASRLLGFVLNPIAVCRSASWPCEGTRRQHAPGTSGLTARTDSVRDIYLQLPADPQTGSCAVRALMTCHHKNGLDAAITTNALAT